MVINIIKAICSYALVSKTENDFYFVETPINDPRKIQINTGSVNESFGKLIPGAHPDWFRKPSPQGNCHQSTCLLNTGDDHHLKKLV